MQRFYGLNLWRTLGSDELPYGRLLRLVRQLPEDAATWRSAHGDDARWTLDRQLLAAIADGVAAGNWQRGGGKGQRPKPIPRPGVTDKAQRVGDASQMTQTEVRALLRARGPEEVADDGS